MAAVAQVESYGFMTEWHDPQADILRFYTLTLFVQPPGSWSPNEVQMFDVKQKRTFLRRAPIESIGLADLIVGGTVTIFSRLLKITGYMDARTREILTSKRQTLTVTLNAGGFRSTGDMLSSISGAGLTVAKLRLIDNGGPTVVCEVVGDDAQAKLEGAGAGQPWFKYARVEVLAVSFFSLRNQSMGNRLFQEGQARDDETPGGSFLFYFPLQATTTAARTQGSDALVALVPYAEQVAHADTICLC